MTSAELLERLIDFAARIGNVVDAMKELRESRCWIRLIIKTQMCPSTK